MSRSKLRLLFWRWHRRFGIATAIFIILVSITGILLNHTSELHLADRPLRQTWLLSLYGIQKPVITSYQLGDQWVSHLGGEYLYLDAKELAYCSGHLHGAISQPEFAVAACGNELLLFTPAGEVVERIGAVYGLPQPLNGLGVCDQQLCVKSGTQLHQVNIEQLKWQDYQGQAVSLTKNQRLPKAIKQPLLNDYYGNAISWERVLLDLHNGHLFQMGPWLMDMVGVLLIVLAVTGVTMWYSGQRRRRH